jgi:hypothetical protein
VAELAAEGPLPLSVSAAEATGGCSFGALNLSNTRFMSAKSGLLKSTGGASGSYSTAGAGGGGGGREAPDAEGAPDGAAALSLRSSSSPASMSSAAASHSRSCTQAENRRQRESVSQHASRCAKRRRCCLCVCELTSFFVSFFRCLLRARLDGFPPLPAYTAQMRSERGPVRWAAAAEEAISSPCEALPLLSVAAPSVADAAAFGAGSGILLQCKSMPPYDVSRDEDVTWRLS